MMRVAFRSATSSWPKRSRIWFSRRAFRLKAYQINNIGQFVDLAAAKFDTKFFFQRDQNIDLFIRILTGHVLGGHAQLRHFALHAREKVAEFRDFLSG
jgi:hypothetical protein